MVKLFGATILGLELMLIIPLGMGLMVLGVTRSLESALMEWIAWIIGLCFATIFVAIVEVTVFTMLQIKKIKVKVR